MIADQMRPVTIVICKEQYFAYAYEIDGWVMYELTVGGVVSIQ